MRVATGKMQRRWCESTRGADEAKSTDESDWTLKHYATKADVANLKVWIVGLLLVVVLNVVGTAGAIVAAFLAG